MKKVININFQGRVIPIEETAFEELQQYIASLRQYFAREEGRDEIINDIENRIAELMGESLKKGSACITDEHLNRIVSGIGRPADLDAAAQHEDTGAQGFGTGGSTAGAQPGQGAQQPGGLFSGPKRLYRDEQDKVLGGVASGLAHYLGIDPAIVRIILLLMAFFGGSGVIIYIVMWIILPSKSLVTNIRKKLYRDTEDRVIGGVCGGLAKYFDINPLIPRVIFAAPFLLGILASIGNSIFSSGSFVIGSFGGGTFILVYIILWMVLPEAFTAAEKLEMRGEKVDLNSIRNTVVNDLQGFKGRAEQMGSELKQSAERIGHEVKDALSSSASQVGNDLKQASRRSSGLGHAIAILAKAFVYFILGIIGFALFVCLIALLVAGIGAFPIYGYLFDSPLQKVFAFGTLILFLGVPIISLLVWAIRRLMKVKTHSKYLGYGMSALWILGWGCVMGLIITMKNSFNVSATQREDIAITQPAGNQLEVDLDNGITTDFSRPNWVRVNGLLGVDKDSMFVNTVRVEVLKSPDDSFRLKLMKMSGGSSRNQAESLTEKIVFPVQQRGNTIYLPEYFIVHKSDKWRNQRVVVVVEVPVGKSIRLSDAVNDYNYFSINESDTQLRYLRDRSEGDNRKNGTIRRMTEDGLEWNNSDSWQEGGNMEPKKQPDPARDSTTTPPSKADTVKPLKEAGYRFETGLRVPKVLPPLASVLKLY